MRTLTAIFCLIGATSAQAHVGHVAEVAGHDHWVAGAVIGVAVLAGLYGALKGKKDDAEAEEASDVEEEEVPA